MKYFGGGSQVSDDSDGETDVSTSEETSWVNWFCRLQGNEFFA